MIKFLKANYKKIWVPVMGRFVTLLIPLIEGRTPDKKPTFDIDGDKKLERNS